MKQLPLCVGIVCVTAIIITEVLCGFDKHRLDMQSLDCLSY